MRSLALVLLAAALIAGDVVAMGRTPLLHGKRPAGRTLHGPEALLVESLLSIRDKRLGDALRQIDSLLALKPNFRLAQLIRGDLLLARARPLNTMGEVDNAPADLVDELRHEARARLQRYQMRPPVNRVPKFLVQLQPQQRYALVVDSANSTLYLFENQAGAARYAADFYVTVGKNGIEKLREGDKKTPLGVYHVVTELPRADLTDFYGAGAFPLNYPNEWDARLERRGHGIWLHGTPLDTYSRPPRASDGCLVLTNQDLDALRPRLQTGVTPVIIAESMEWEPPEQVAARRAVLAARLERWRADRESRDIERYLAHYSRSFSADGVGLDQWAVRKRKVGATKQWIKLQLTEISILLYPGREELAVVTFLQDYESNNLSEVVRKRQYWIRESGTWKIAYEGAA